MKVHFWNLKPFEPQQMVNQVHFRLRLDGTEEQGARLIEKGKYKKIALASKQLTKQKRDIA